MNYPTPSRPAEALAPYAAWRLSAACRQADPELFFPVGTTGPAIDQIGQAKRICQACSVREDCLGWALRNGIAFGIWGGASEEDRQVLRRAFGQRVTHEG
jgi:WhiB family transcriptional regulator, redox-sensing transcriptional regulator